MKWRDLLALTLVDLGVAAFLSVAVVLLMWAWLLIGGAMGKGL